MTTATLEKPSHTEVTRTEPTRARQTFRPNVDIIERIDELLVLADMPGARADDVDVKFENGMLTIYARVQERQPENVQYALHEYAVGDYLRTFQVGETIDADRISAEMSAGVLTLHLPKTERVKPKRISVAAN